MTYSSFLCKVEPELIQLLLLSNSLPDPLSSSSGQLTQTSLRILDTLSEIERERERERERLSVKPSSFATKTHTHKHTPASWPEWCPSGSTDIPPVPGPEPPAG